MLAVYIGMLKGIVILSWNSAETTAKWSDHYVRLEIRYVDQV